MKRKQISSEINKKLYEIANTQMGYFTTQQARLAGIPDSNHPYHIKTGHFRREKRGIFRLQNYPISDHEEMMVWYLWARNRKDIPQGVFSHDTALDIYELSDINPSKFHLTVPKTFQRFNDIPKEICLHKGDLKKKEVKGYHGMKVTTPIKTLVDLVAEGKIAPELIKQAVNQATQKGLITKINLDVHPEIMKYWQK